MAYRIILRRDTASNWTSNNPVLLAGEPGYETDTGKMKMGDGESPWNNLEYFVINPTGVTGATGSAGATGPGVDLLSVASHIIPATGGVYDLGATAGYEWRDLYLSGNSIYLGGVKIASDGTNVNMNSMIIGGPTGQGGVLLSATGGTIFSDGVPIGSAGIIDIEYADLRLGATSGTLIPGSYYRITDFRTCYDQPDYNYSKNPITSGNYKEADVDPIIVFAISNREIDSTAYQPSHPNDRIRYDLSYSQTETTGGTAYGRISERIDNFNNRTDYDHRTILFKRYMAYSYNLDIDLSGLVGISGYTLLGLNGSTQFLSELSVGEVISITPNELTPINNPLILEVTSIADDFTAGVTGYNIFNVNSSKYYKTYTEGYISYYQPNVTTDGFSEYTTFGDAIDSDGAFNNYIGNQANLFFDSNLGDFLLANNVFLSGVYRNNIIGNGSFNNTFNDDCVDNIIGSDFRNNLTNDDFDDNFIGTNFSGNFITSNFQNNRVGNDFTDNVLFGGSFYRNNIGNGFDGNLWLLNEFQNNEIGNGFNNNLIYRNFYKNDVGNGYNGNDVFGQHIGCLIGNGFNGNTIFSRFEDNIIGDYFGGNTIGQSGSIDSLNFERNNLGYNFSGNTIISEFSNNSILNSFNQNSIYSVFRKNRILNNFNTCTLGSTGGIGDYTFENNEIMDNFKGNDIQGDFWSNRLKTDFKGNEINAEFGYNNFGYGCVPNTFDGQTIHNNVGDNFSFNTCNGSFSYNNIGSNFGNNTIGDGFGFGGGQPRGNKIGNEFRQNTIGEYFYNNIIEDNFYDHTIGDGFRMNNVAVNNLNGYDFLEFLGNISNLTFVPVAAVDGTYTTSQTSTTGQGQGAQFGVIVTGGTTSSISINKSGNGYQSGDQITINANQFQGAGNLVITITSVSDTPLVYTDANCTIQKSIDGFDVITAIDWDNRSLYISIEITGPYQT